GGTSIPGGLGGVVAISASEWHNLALKSDGTIVGWGSDNYGQNEVPRWPTRAIGIADGLGYSLAILAPPLTLSNPRWQNGLFTVSVPTQAGKSYVLQYKAALPDS